MYKEIKLQANICRSIVIVILLELKSILTYKDCFLSGHTVNKPYMQYLYIQPVLDESVLSGMDSC